MKVTVEVAGQLHEIEIQQRGENISVRYGDREWAACLVHTESAGFVLDYDEPREAFVNRRRLRVAGFTNGDERQLWVNGRTVSYRRARNRGPLRQSETTSPSFESDALMAPIPAIVSEILVQPGDPVERGDKLILLESMKMILPIQATRAGTVATINCETGQAVQPGVPLIELR